MAVNRPQIGAQTFLYLGPNPGAPGFLVGRYGEVVEDISRAGIDGHAFKKMGARGEPFMIVSLRDYETEAAAKEGIRQYELLIATFATLELPDGETFTNVFIRDCRDFQISPIVTAAGYISTNPPTKMLMATWELQRTEALAAP